VDANGREREIGSSQPENAEAEEKRKEADRSPGRERRRGERPTVRAHQEDANVAAKSEEDDAAEIDIAGVTEHQIQIARERDVNGRKQQALAQFNVLADEGREREGGDDERDDPEKRAA